MNRTDAELIAKISFNIHSNGKRLGGRSRNQWNYLQANLKECELFDWKKKSTDRGAGRWDSVRAVGTDNKKKICHHHFYQ